MTQRLAILATHPVQYFAPWYRALSRRSDLETEVFFMHRQSARQQGEAGFGVAFDWDTQPLEGFHSRFLTNVSDSPGLDGFSGCDVPELPDLLRKGAFDVLLVQGWNYKGYWQGIQAARRASIPVLVRGDSHLHTRRPLWSRLAKYPLYRYFIPRFDGYLTVGLWNAEYYLHYGADPSRFHFTPHCIDNDGFATAAAKVDRLALLRRWGIDPGYRIFLFAGKLTDVKRPMDFVRAIAKAARRAPIAGIIVGDGPLRAALEIEVQRLRAPVYFRGFQNQSQMPSAYAVSDALVVTSAQETWGLVVNEAMACGRAAIITDRVGCGPDLVLSQKTGERVPVGDVDAMSRVLIDAVTSDKLERWGEFAGMHIRQYSIDAAVAGTLNAMGAVGETGQAALCA